MEEFLKKFFVVFGLLLTGCGADTALLGYENAQYYPVRKKDVAVYYDFIPQNCPQIGMTVLTVGGYLEEKISELRENAAKIGGNFVNIINFHYNAGYFNSNVDHITGVIYRCQTLQALQNINTY